MKDAWSKVTAQTINNCFKFDGWKKCDDTPTVELPVIQTPENLTAEDWMHFINQDDNVETNGCLEDEEVTQIVKRRRLPTTIIDEFLLFKKK